MSFAPKMAALPEAQKALWPQLRQVPSRFVLYGGTAIALRLGHRTSVDFDFFATAPVNPAELLENIGFLKGAHVRDQRTNTLTVSVGQPEGVKLSFFGLQLGRVRNPEFTDDGVMQVASLLDLAACKLAVIIQRAELRDYQDIHALLANGVTLADALGAARAIYGEQFNPIISVKALASFADGDLRNLPQALQKDLRQAAGAVKQITDFERMPGGISPGT